MTQLLWNVPKWQNGSTTAERREYNRRTCFKWRKPFSSSSPHAGHIHETILQLKVTLNQNSKPILNMKGVKQILKRSQIYLIVCT